MLGKVSLHMFEALQEKPLGTLSGGQNGQHHTSWRTLQASSGANCQICNLVVRRLQGQTKYHGRFCMVEWYSRAKLEEAYKN